MFGGEGLVATISPTLGCKALQANKTGDGQDLRHPHPCPSLLGIGVSITTAMALRTSIVTLKALAGGHNPGCFVSQFPRRQRIVRSSNYGHGRDAYRLFSLTSPRDGPHYHNCETSASNLGRQIAEVLRNKGTRLILHLDVNKTLIMVDPSGGKTQSQVRVKEVHHRRWLDGCGSGPAVHKCDPKSFLAGHGPNWQQTSSSGYFRGSIF